jgi:hypothetical protein
VEEVEEEVVLIEAALISGMSTRVRFFQPQQKKVFPASAAPKKSDRQNR